MNQEPDANQVQDANQVLDVTGNNENQPEEMHDEGTGAIAGETSDKAEPDKDRLKATLEAILFTMGESVDIDRLALVIEQKKSFTKKLLKEMEEEYTASHRGITLLWLEDAVQLCTKSEFYSDLIKIAKTPKKITLTDTVIETLSIIAYKQPVTRQEIERIRGVSCDHAMNKLLEYDLITELGRLDAPGRPLLFGTTEQFLRCFGVSSIDELPEIDHVKMEEFKVEAEKEISGQGAGDQVDGQISLDI